jgi:hypothetical protein
MSTFFYDFNTKKQVNPLDGITHFFVNPYMPESFRALNLGNKIINNQVETDLVIQESTGLPVIILPIELLDLSMVKVKVEDNLNMTVYTPQKRLYMKPTNEPHIVRIDSVLF